MTFSDLMHCMTIYLDSIIVFSPSVELHLLDLNAVLEKLHNEKLFTKHKKCFFGKMSVKYLGHIVEVGSLRADKVEAIPMLPKPTMVEEL